MFDSPADRLLLWLLQLLMVLMLLVVLLLLLLLYLQDQYQPHVSV